MISSHILREVSNVTRNEISDNLIDIITHIEEGINGTKNEISDKPIDIMTHIDAGTKCYSQ